MVAIANVKVIESMIEIPAAQYRKVDREAKVGDLIRFDDESSYVTRGGYYEVVRVDSAGDPQILNNDGDEYDLACDEYEVYEKVTESAKQEPKPATPPTRIPVGSYVKTPDRERIYNSIERGAFGKVVEDDNSHVPYKVESLDSSDYGWYKADELTVLSEAEAKAAVEVEAERAKWAAIGREVGEYKRGDIVHYVCKNGSIGIGTVEDVGQHAIGVRNDIKTHSDAKYKGVFFRERDTATLIVPVEQRFDRVAVS